MLFVGINPGIRSAEIGHHFAGHSNRFWKLLHESGLVPEALGAEDDVRLPEWRFGITNVVPRATPGIDTLRPEEYARGLHALRRKVRRWKPDVVAFVGVTIYRLVRGDGSRSAHSSAQRLPAPRTRTRLPSPLIGLRPELFEGARVFVLPNPSGRNANFTYVQMLGAFRSLAVFLHRHHDRY